jgi:AraC-like DNA-binding protein
MQDMKLAVEEVRTEPGRSFVIHHHPTPDACQSPFWHCHPEVEIVYIPRGKGKRFVGNHMSTFEDGDLIILGTYLPHHSFSQGFEGDHYEEYVLQLKTNAFAQLLPVFPEFQPIIRFFEQARQGLCVTSARKHQWGAQLIALRQEPALNQLLGLLQFLHALAQYEGIQTLGAGTFAGLRTRHNERIQQVYQLIENEYMHPLSSRQVAEKLAMTESSFCRFFQQHTHLTFKQALTQVRILRACRLLTKTQTPVHQIAFDCGYRNVSLFNRLFQSVMKVSPTAYRKQFCNEH